MARYQVGDIVIVRTDLEIGHTYYMHDSNVCDTFISQMSPFCGKEVTIATNAFGKYQICEGGCNWTDEMFDGPSSNHICISDEALINFL